jgi:transcriptional regulator of aromatic amino acid metabolism
MRRVFREISELGRLDTTAVVEGETGTGNELVARELHAVSRRSGKPFAAVDCAGLTESLLSSQLFGHNKGAFTGAIADQQGLFGAAQGGALFLDEIGDMPPAVQATSCAFSRSVRSHGSVRTGRAGSLCGFWRRRTVTCEGASMVLMAKQKGPAIVDPQERAL